MPQRERPAEGLKGQGESYVRSHVKASFAGSNRVGGRERRRMSGLACLCVLGLVAFLGSSAPAASAADECPNVVFRTGPSAKLPECRAYELVTPAYTGGLPPQMNNVFAWGGVFAFPLITPNGDSVTYQTLAGTIGNFPGSGYVDRYEAKRTAEGWATEFTGVTGTDGPETYYGGSSPDHQYYFATVGGADNRLEPESPLLAPFGGFAAQYLRKPGGQYELIGRGSLDESPDAAGHLITNGASHVIFSDNTKLEPQAPPTGTTAVYDRTPGGPTHVVSLLPGDEPTTAVARYQGASSDGSEIVFGVANTNNESTGTFFVRIDNITTEEVARADEVAIGEELTCTGGPGGATLSYQWLNNGTPIGGATSATYVTTAADAGEVVQCQVIASNSEGAGVAASHGKLVRPSPATAPPDPCSPATLGHGREIPPSRTSGSGTELKSVARPRPRTRQLAQTREPVSSVG
jgi:hypothetical protein